MEKKSIGPVFAMYPMPLGVIAVMDSDTGKANFMEIGHVGIISHRLLSVSLHHAHFTTAIALKEKKLSFNFVNEKMLARTDYAGMVSGSTTDKSALFCFHLGEGGTPVIDDADCTMELAVVDDYEKEGFHNLICEVTGTYVNPDMIDDKGKPDYAKFKPILFEMPSYKYLATGEVVDNCLKLGKEIKSNTSASGK